MSAVVEKILSLMKSKGVSGTTLTSELGISSSSITEWKKGKANPGVEAIIKIARFFEVSIDYLLGETDDPAHEAENQIDRGDSAVSNKAEPSPVDTDVLVAKGNIVIERNKNSDNTRIVLPPTPASYDLAYRLATEITTEITVESPSSPSPTSEPRKDRDEARGKILCLHPGCNGELRRLQREDGTVIWECLNCGRTYEEKAA